VMTPPWAVQVLVINPIPLLRKGADDYSDFSFRKHRLLLKGLSAFSQLSG